MYVREKRTAYRLPTWYYSIVVYNMLGPTICPPELSCQVIRPRIIGSLAVKVPAVK